MKKIILGLILVLGCNPKLHKKAFRFNESNWNESTSNLFRKTVNRQIASEKLLLLANHFSQILRGNRKILVSLIESRDIQTSKNEFYIKEIVSEELPYYYNAYIWGFDDSVFTVTISPNNYDWELVTEPKESSFYLDPKESNWLYDFDFLVSETDSLKLLDTCAISKLTLISKIEIYDGSTKIQKTEILDMKCSDGLVKVETKK